MGIYKMNEETGTLMEIKHDKPTFLGLLSNYINNHPQRQLNGSEEVFWLYMWRNILTAVVIIVLGLVAESMHSNTVNREIEKAHIYGGYCQLSVVGVNTPVWQKCPK